MACYSNEVDTTKAQYRRQSFSQFGEDSVLAWVFPEKTQGFYVDVGCHHPFRISNTALLHCERGWRGLNIDVDDRAIDAFKKFRPDDINICVGVAGSPGEMEVTIFEEGAINTFSESSASHPAWAGISRQKKIVKVETLASLLDRHLPAETSIDLLNLDAEGLDFEILGSNNWDKYRPEVIMVEAEVANLADISTSQVHALLSSMGYLIISQVAITSVYRLSR